MRNGGFLAPLGNRREVLQILERDSVTDSLNEKATPKRGFIL
jgi:hypothetical protein